jgi:transcriptional regulator with XRE-family HTH domain
VQYAQQGDVDFSAKLQYYRRLRQLSLRDLAGKAGCSGSLLSMIEHGKVSPSLRVAENICAAFDMTLSDFLRMETTLNDSVLTSRTRGHLNLVKEWPGSRMLQIKSPAHNQLQGILLQIDGGCSMPIRQSMRSSNETSVVLKGEVGCWVGNNQFLMRTGEYICFDVQNAYRWWNRGTELAEVLTICPIEFCLFEKIEMEVLSSKWRKQYRRKTKTLKQDPSEALPLSMSLP